MHEWFCGRTAFHCHRTPPQLKCLMPLFPDIGYPKQKLALKRQYNDACGWKNVLVHFLSIPSYRNPTFDEKEL